MYGVCGGECLIIRARKKSYIGLLLLVIIIVFRVDHRYSPGQGPASPARVIVTDSTVQADLSISFQIAMILLLQGLVPAFFFCSARVPFPRVKAGQHLGSIYRVCQTKHGR
jgi:hypothetical protein